MRLNFTTTAIALMALIASPVVAQDIVVNYRTTDGKTESTTVDRKQLPEIKKFMEAGIPLPAEQKRLLKSPMKSPDPGTETPEGFKVTFAVEDEATEGFAYEPWKIYVTQPDDKFGDGYYNYAYYPTDNMIAQGKDWWGCYIPDGTYSVILATGRRYGKERKHEAYIVKNDVVINQDTTITFRQSDAKNLLTSKFLYPDGSVMEPLTKETSKYCNYSFFRCLNNSRGIYCFNLMNTGGIRDTLYVNNLDETWTYAVNQVTTNQNGTYVNKVVVPGPFTQNTEFVNNPADYLETTAHFTPLPDTDMDVNGYGVKTFMTWKGADWDASANTVRQQEGSYNGNIKMYLNNRESDLSPSTGYDVFAAPVIIKRVIIHTQEMNGETRVSKELVTASGTYFLPNQNGNFLFTDGSKGYSIAEYPKYEFFLPSESQFDYCSEDITFFNTAPIIMLPSIISRYHDRYETYIINGSAVGSYPAFEGNNLTIDRTITNNGNSYQFAPDERFLDWSAAGNYVPGPVVLDFSTVYKSENEKDYFTSASFSFDTARDKYCPPMVSRWQLRNGDKAPSSAIENGSAILLEVTDSDNDENDVKCYYAVSGTNNWKELPVQTTADSGIYKADLSTISSTEDESLYDLQFRLADEAGNSAVQTIEGAMTYSSQSGITTTETDKVDITVSGDSIIAPEGSEVYNVAGQRCRATGLQPGIYIVRTAGKSVKVVVK